eukprot:m.243190 g.243190  ORF g.243190 m.243190 type:complete len:403 (-) comp41206_c0_seq1:5-1213(-)
MTLTFNSVTGFVESSTLCDRRGSLYDSLFKPLESVCDSLPSLINKSTPKECVCRDAVMECVESVVEDLGDGIEKALSSSNLSVPQMRHLYHLTMLLVNAYVWCNGENVPAESIPSPLSTLAVIAAKNIGNLPILTHCVVSLFNVLPIEGKTFKTAKTADDFVVMRTFTGTRDEEWFYLVTVEIELNTVNVMKAMEKLIKDPKNIEEKDVLEEMGAMCEGIEKMTTSLGRMEEHLDADVFYTHLRPFLSGWKNNKNCSKGIPFEGEDPLYTHLSGASASQSTSIAMIDAFIGTVYPQDHFLVNMRSYMPADHRQSLQHVIESSGVLRERIHDMSPDTVEAFNNIVKCVRSFRTKHIQIVTRYVVTPSLKHKKKGEGEVLGTGGTTPIRFLKDVREQSDNTIIT